MPRLSMPSPSMGVALTALVVALGGTSYAAIAVTSKDVRNESLRGIDVRNGTLTGADVKNRSLQAKDFRRGQLPRGAQGVAGPTGPTGPAGAAGPAGVGRWALINGAGAIEAQSGGFTVVSGYGTDPAGAAGNVYINAGENLANNGIVATIALQNQSDQNGDTVVNGRAPGADANPEFSGEISVSMCAIAGVVACAPPGTNTTSHLVVSPRLSDGQVTEAANRKRFYVVVTGDSSDRVA